MMKILILGDSGFIGKSFIKQYINDYTIIGIDKIDTNIIGYQHYTKDLTNSDIIKNILVKEKPEIIINSAATLGVSKVKSNPLDTIDNNLDITKKLITSLNNIDYKPLIFFFSSSEVYGNNTNCNINENIYNLFPSSERGCYAISKLLEENIYNIIQKSNKADVIIMRLFNIVGELQNNNFVINKMIKDIKEKYVTITPTYRNFCYIGFLLDTIKKILDEYSVIGKTDFPHICNFGSLNSKNYISMYTLYNIIKDCMKNNNIHITDITTFKDVDETDIIIRKNSSLTNIPEKYLDLTKDISINEIVQKIIR